MKAVLIRISTQEIIKKAKYPRLDMKPVSKLEDDLEWLIVNELDRPIYDIATERIERFEEITTDPHPIYTDLNQYRVGYNKITLTQEEQDEYTQQQEDNDSSAQKFSKYKNDGVQGFDRAYSLIVRKVDNGTITKTQGKNLAQGLYPNLEPLYKGLWQLVKSNLANATLPNNADLLAIFNKIKNGVDNYVQNNY